MITAEVVETKLLEEEIRSHIDFLGVLYISFILPQKDNKLATTVGCEMKHRLLFLNKNEPSEVIRIFEQMKKELPQ